MATSSPEILEKTIRLHATQAGFRRSSALYRGFVGGRGSGKSWVGAYDILRRAKRGRTYLIGSPTAVLMRDTTYPTTKEIAMDLGIWDPDAVTISPYPTAELSTGATIRFRTAEDPEKLRGPNLSGVWLDEASLMHGDAYNISIACLRECGEQGWLSATFTPKGLNHWTYDVFGQVPAKPNTELFRCRTDDNPFLPAEFEDTLTRQYGEGSRLALQELGGEFCSMDGVEWPPEYFGPHIWFDAWPEPDLILKVMALDPSKGKQDRSGDYWAWTCLAIDRQWNLWADSLMDNAGPIEPVRGGELRGTIVGEGLRLYHEFRPSAIIVETNGFQELVATALARWGITKGLNLPIWTLNSTEPKPARIRTLGTYLANRRLRIRKTRGGELLVAQMRDFTGDPRSEVHDDGPDSLKMAEQLADHLLNGRRVGPGPQLLVT